MAILSDKQILDRLGDSVIIDPFNPENVNTSSYDVTLGKNYFIEHRPGLLRRLFGATYNIWDIEEIRRVWGRHLRAQRAHKIFGRRNRLNGISPNDFVILIPPKHTILAHTVEFIGGRQSTELYPGSGVDFPSTSMMKARSSMGRNFIEVCKCAGYGDVGYTNRWTMEITNNSRYYHIPLVCGRRIAQIVFMETGELNSRADYTASGKYQTTADLEKLKKEWRPEMMLPRLDRDRDIYPRNIAIGCKARQYSDYTECKPCGLGWDTNDIHRPKCPVVEKGPPRPEPKNPPMMWIRRRAALWGDSPEWSGS